MNLTSLMVIFSLLFLGSPGVQAGKVPPKRKPSPSPPAAASPAPSPSPSASVAASSPEYPMETKIGGPASRYTAYLLKLLKAWPPADQDYAASPDGNPVPCRAIETPGDEYYIGLDQWMRVEAPLERVAAVLDDVAHYQQLFPGFDEVKLISRDENRFLTFWEQHISVPLVPNVKYSIDYLVARPKPGMRVYCYQFMDSEGDRIKNNDGVIVLEVESPTRQPAQHSKKHSKPNTSATPYSSPPRPPNGRK
jgi:hypothetical protein